MTKTWPLLLAFCVFAFFPAAGQEAVSLRAAEQSTYSRIVVPVAPDAEWEFTTFNRQAVLRIPGVVAGFDTSQIFDRIPKTRVLNVSSETEGGASLISLSLACDCSAEASVSGRYVLIDVFDPEARDPSLANRAVPIGQAASDPSDSAAPSGGLTSARAPSRRPTPEGQAADQPQQVSAEEMAASSAEADPSEPSSPEADEVAEHLIRQLQRAAGQGLVDLQPEPNAVPETASVDQTQAPTPEPETSLEPFAENSDGMEALAERLEQALAGNGTADITDAIRLKVPAEVTAPPAVPASPSSLQEQQAQGSTDHCLEEYYYDFSVLEPNKRPVDQIVELRSKLLGEFDKADSTTAVELARLYIALGMGVEAQGLVTEFLNDSQQRAILEELAQVVEGSEMPAGSHLDQSAGCSGPVAIWRTAGVSSSETQPVPDADDIVDGLADLPVELRRTLVPRTIASFIRRGQIGAAEASFAILDRAPGNHGPEHEFQRAVLLKLSGEALQAEAIFLGLSARSDPTGPRALMALVESMVDRGRRVPPALISDLSSLARQFRDDPLGVQLRHSEITAKAGNGRFAEALSVVAREIDESPGLAADYVAVADQLLTNTKSADISAGVYATAIFDNMGLLTRDDVSDKARLNVAKELIGIGLPGSAVPLVNASLSKPPAETPPSVEEREARLALGRAYLLMDEPEMSLEVLPPNPTDAETDVRIAALSKLGRHQAALAEAKMLDKPQNVAELGFRAGDWTLAGEDPNLSGALARYMLRTSGTAGEDLAQASEPDLRAIETPVPAIDAVTLELAETVRSQSESLRRILATELGDPS